MSDNPHIPYTPELADQVCALVSGGVSMRTINALPGMPSMQTIFKWMREMPEFSERYARAKDEASEAMIEDMLAIADDSEHDIVTRYNEQGKPYEAVDHDHINRSRLRVDTRKWIAAKLKPKKYGDATMLKHADANGESLKIEVTRVLDTPKQVLQIEATKEPDE